VGAFPEFGIDERGYQCLNTLFMVGLFDSNAAHFTLGVLNSAVVRYYWSKKFTDGRDTFPKIKGTYLKQLPVIEFDSGNKQHLAVASAVAKILTALDSLAKARTESERRIAIRKVTGLNSGLQARIGSLYGLDGEQIESIQESLRGDSAPQTP
jgi:hypothetical protein